MRIKKQHMPKMESWSVRLTRWVGSTASLATHTVLFIAVFTLGLIGLDWNGILLVLTTVLSLEAIYLAIFIQMTVNRNTESLEEVEEDIDEIQVDIDELQEDVDEIQEDVGEIAEDVDEIQEDVQELDAEEEKSGEVTLEMIYAHIKKLSEDVETLKAKKPRASSKV